MIDAMVANPAAQMLQAESSLLACSVDSDGDNVTNFTSADASAVQQAVDQASPGDLLRVSGTCVGVQMRAGFSQTVYISQSVTIQGGYDPNDWTVAPDPDLYPTLLDAAGNGRVVYIPSGNAVFLDSLTLSHGNGSGGNGGGIFADINVIWTLTNSILSENTSDFLGGGIYNAASPFTLSNSTVMNNTTSSLGGGLYSAGAVMVDIDNSMVHNNSALAGAGIYLDNSGTLSLDDSIVHDNNATSNGGGIFAATNTSWSLTNSTLSENTSGFIGGGIYNAAFQFTMTDSTIISNTTGSLGGGLHSNGPVTVNIDNSVIQNNSATLGGGIHLDNNGTINLDNSTVQSNHATTNGGGLANDTNTGTINVTNSTIISNTADDSGAGIFNNGHLIMNDSTTKGNEAVDDGGGILNHISGQATIINSVIENNIAFDSAPIPVQVNRGAGIYNRLGGTVTVMTSTLQYNSAVDNGGGIWNEGDFTLISSTVFSNTSASNGGGMWNSGVLMITTSDVISNSSPGNAGGLINTNAATISDSTFAYNRANDGGAIYSTGLTPALSIMGSTFHDNYVEGVGNNRGGAIYVNGGQLNMVNSTLSHNTASNEGGALGNEGISHLIHTTIVSNSIDTGTGSALYNAGATSVMTLTNTAVAYNSGGANVDCGVAAGSVVDDGYNLVEDGSCIFAGTSLSGDPLLGPLADNGGNTLTHQPLAFSPVIDQIPVPSCGAADDQIGTARPVDGACDIGSVELAVNFAPIAVADEYTTTEDILLTVAAAGVLANDIDADFGPLTAVLDTDVTDGTLTLNADGSFTYLPDADFCGTDSFTYHANDGYVDSNSVVVTLNITCANEPPVAVDDNYAGTEDTTLLVSAPGVLDNDTDFEGDPLTAVLDTDVTTGTLTLNTDGSFSYTPNADFCGTDSFTYYANDGVNSDMSATVTLDIACVNDAPVAVADNYATDEDTTLTVLAPGVLSNDIDVDGDSLTAVLDSDVTTGTLTLNTDGSFSYIPSANFCGTDGFTYHVNDGSVDSGTVNVTLDVTCVNDAPVAVADNYATDEDTTLTVPAPGVLSNDSDIEGDALTAVLDTDVTTGTLTLNADGSFAYTPDADFCGSDSFTYHANDGQADSTPVAVTIDVACTPDLPIANDDVYATLEDTQLTVPAPGVLSNDNDPDGDPLTAVLDTTVVTGTLVFTADGSFTFTPLMGWSGITTFTYHVEANGDSSNTALVRLVVGAVNEAPVALDDSYATDEDVTLNVAAPGVLDNDTDADGDSLTAVLEMDVMSGTLTLNSDGSFGYVPPLDWSGVTTFTYHANDGLFDSNTAVVTITVNSLNDAPVAVADSYSTDEDVALVVPAPGVLDNDSDVDGDALTAVLDSDVSNGSLALNADGSFTYTPAADFCGADSFTYHNNDGQLDSNTVTVDLDITCVNDMPVALDDMYAVAEDVALTVPAPGVLSNDSDVDGDALTAVLESGVTTGTLVFNADGSFTYDPDTGFCGPDSFTYHANDGQVDSNTVTVTLNVACGNTAPVAVDDNYAVNENSSGNVLNVLVNDSDADGNSLTIVAVSAAGNGTAVISGNTILYTPDPDFVGVDTFTYTISDGSLTDTATVSVTVNEVQTGFMIYLPFVVKN